MSKRDPKLLIEDVLDSAHKIVDYTKICLYAEYNLF